MLISLKVPKGRGPSFMWLWNTVYVFVCPSCLQRGLPPSLRSPGGVTLRPEAIQKTGLQKSSQTFSGGRERETKDTAPTVPRTVPKLKWTGGCWRKTASLVMGPRLAIPPGFQFQFRRRERISSIGGFNSLRSCWEKQRATSLDSALKFPLS